MYFSKKQATTTQLIPRVFGLRPQTDNESKSYDSAQEGFHASANLFFQFWWRQKSQSQFWQPCSNAKKPSFDIIEAAAVVEAIFLAPI